jgi:hypothetical protein
MSADSRLRQGPVLTAQFLLEPLNFALILVVLLLEVLMVVNGQQ